MRILNTAGLTCLHPPRCDCHIVGPAFVTIIRHHLTTALTCYRLDNTTINGTMEAVPKSTSTYCFSATITLGLEAAAVAGGLPAEAVAAAAEEVVVVVVLLPLLLPTTPYFFLLLPTTAYYYYYCLVLPTIY